MIEKKKKKKRFFFFFFIFFLKAIKFTESAAFCPVGRVTGNNNKFLLGPICFRSDLEAIYLKKHIPSKTLRNGHSVDFI